MEHLDQIAFGFTSEDTLRVRPDLSSATTEELLAELKSRGERTLEEEHERVMRERWAKEGTHCLACSQKAQVYARGLGLTHLKLMRGLLRASGPERSLVHVSKIKVGSRDAGSYGGDLGKLRYYGLAETGANTDDSKTHSGEWRWTEKTLRFLRGEIKIPKHMYVFDGKVLRVSDEKISVHEVGKRKKFDLQDLFQELRWVLDER